MNNINNLGMNQIGMNQMGVNPMLINNMMINNNQPNLMDQTALNIKSIILPYENKIRELEEIIKQKDFEITVLKQKLNNSIKSNNNINNNNNNNLLNMNPMMNAIMDPWINHYPIEQKEEITLKIKNKITDVKCYKDEKLSTFKFQNLKLTFNYRPLSEEKTLEENGIMNGSTIYITDPIYRLTFGASNDKKIFIALDGDCPLDQAIIFYCNQFKNNNIYQLVISGQIVFIYSAMKLNIYDKTPIKRVFKGTIPIIIVNDLNNVIGG